MIHKHDDFERLWSLQLQTSKRHEARIIDLDDLEYFTNPSSPKKEKQDFWGFDFWAQNASNIGGFMC